MSHSCRTLWIICLVTIVGCSASHPDDGEDRRSFKSLAQAYKDAHARKNVDALLKLVYVGSGPEREVNLREFRASFKRDVEQDIKLIYRTRLGWEEREPHKYATLRPLGLMTVEWVTHDENHLFSSVSYCFGKCDGIYHIVATGPRLREEGLKKLIEGVGPGGKFPGVQQRAKSALSKWQNQNIDPEPILFWAALSSSRAAENPEVLALRFFDEDMDVIGFGIEEHHVDANGTRQVRIEEYPAFAYWQWSDISSLRIIPIHCRDAGQRRDEEQWHNYMEGVGIDPNTPMSRKYWEETLPPVWVSIPEAKTMDVHVYLYDRAGHKSERVRLLNLTREDYPR